MKLRIKYFEGATKLQKIEKGNWIDVYAREDVFIPLGEQRLIPLGFALELPKGWEGHLAPRSSTFKKWGIIETNSIGVVDDSYIGNDDEWKMPVYCLNPKNVEFSEQEVINKFGSKWNKIEVSETGERYTFVTEQYPNGTVFLNKRGTWIHKGDKIGQFRIMEVMPEIELEEVESLNNESRGGFGSTGSR